MTPTTVETYFHEDFRWVIKQMFLDNLLVVFK
jgi:hypothetical protein